MSAATPHAWLLRLSRHIGKGWVAAFGLVLWAATAGAQGQPTPGASSESIAADSVMRVLGRDVIGPKGEVVAQVVNVLVDVTGQPRAAILDYGGFLGVGKRRIAVAWSVLRFAPDEKAGSIALNLGQDQLRNFPEFRPDAPLVVAVPPEPSQPDALPAARD
jgi:hypothetical protein